MEVTDPMARRDIAEAKKEVNDPINRDKYQQLEKDVNDPEFVKALASDPRRRAEVKRMVETVNMANMEENMSGTIVIQLKGKNSAARLHTALTGQMGVLHEGTNNITYTLDHKAKTYSVTHVEPIDPLTTVVTKTDETETILEYRCTKYTMLKKTSSGTTLTSIWSTTELKDIDLSTMSLGAGSPLVFNVGEGVTLKTQRKLSHGVLTTELTSIEKGPVASSEFAIPEGYTEKGN